MRIRETVWIDEHEVVRLANQGLEERIVRGMQLLPDKSLGMGPLQAYLHTLLSATPLCQESSPSGTPLRANHQRSTLSIQMDSRLHLFLRKSGPGQASSCAQEQNTLERENNQTNLSGEESPRKRKSI